MTHKLLAAAIAVGSCLASACGSTSTPTTPATTTTCTVTVGAPSVATFSSDGGTGTIAVTAASGCAWTATSGAAFITIAQGASGSASGTVQFTVAANTGAADRTGTLTVSGSAVTITQHGTGAAAVTLSAPTTNSPTGGQIVTSSRPTLVVNDATAGAGAGTVTYHFEVSDQSSFPNDPVRTFTADGVPQGVGTTSWTLTRDLGPNVLWYWRARATNGTVTSAFSNVDTFSTGTACGYALSATTLTATNAGGSPTVTVTTSSACAWTAVSNAAFITVASGASGTGNGTVTLTIAQGTGVARTGTVTIAGQTVTVTQTGANLVVGFQMIDPQRGPQPVTECQIRSTTSVPTTCTLQSTSFPTSTNAITNYNWAASYVYPSGKAFYQTGTNPNFSFSDMCGQMLSNDSGYQLELFVSLTVTDSEGSSVTVTSNSGSQPMLTLRAYICGI